jgi:hypothetical protein
MLPYPAQDWSVVGTDAGLDHDQLLDLLPSGIELLGHLEYDKSGATVAAKAVRTIWLNCAYGSDTLSSDVLQRRRRLENVKAIRLHDVKRLVRSKVVRQVEAIGRATFPVHMWKEERHSAAPSLYCYDRGSGPEPSLRVGRAG